MTNLFYKPDGAWVGDLIPFYKDGSFRLFYLHDWRDNKKIHGEGTSWFELHTSDFVHYEEVGEKLKHGSVSEQDLNCYTGSIIEAHGEYHLFYTGLNPNPEFIEDGVPLQCVMHAVSTDMESWRKIPEDTFYSDGIQYERHDWRDPFVFWNEEAGEYWMLLAARNKEGPSRRRGSIGLCASKDLKSWEIRQPFWNPKMYVTHECPDLFQIGEWWYLVYSTFSERFVTHYRMSKSLSGPWTAPRNDAFDARAFYAAKTWSDGNKRYAFGWDPSKENENDYGDWQWAGNLVVHELVQEQDGTLTVRIPETVSHHFSNKQAAKWDSRIGEWEESEGRIETAANETYSCISAGFMPETCKISAELSFSEGTRGCGILLRASEDLDEAYYIRLEPIHNRLVFDMWPRREQGEMQWHIKGDHPHAVELEVPIELQAGTVYNIEIVVENSVCVVYLADQVAMTTRLYNLKTGSWGCFVQEGRAVFEQASISVPN
ncbi:glycoside hydrolase family 32 protein [Paenibacillus riograndensis]|uniref:beta-fructofuranosidase n=1 Tax=Paenibacillus riograndensis SBR5 TaxID=1073571 RepID=A0A0E4CZX8_9BACL|nr:glycoside hydrolase family 32 protein [Paenibacillus riograndensis]CQR59074.1 glycoside hydrolase family protein [Paenibacillus riograndensis SBR5]